MPSVRKFNPGVLQPDEDLTAQFVVRNHEFQLLLDILRKNLGSESCQHLVVVGRRGMGKTMLLARLAGELRTDADLSRRLLPVRFSEENHEILDLADFWCEALFHLARECRSIDPALGEELGAAHSFLAKRWRGEDLEFHARAAVLDAADRLDRRLVLMVENLQTLSTNIGDDFGWRLRKTLQTEPQIALIATATSRFRGLDDASAPFFELFRIIELERLDTKDCRRLWERVSGHPIAERRVRPLEILTGGNPRLLVIVAGFGRRRSLRDLMEQLVALIDDHTEYFRNYLEGIAKTERRVYLAVIDLWQPSTSQEIADRARLDIRNTSALLGRLTDRGAVEVEQAGKKRRYQAVERLYCLYYKLRRERDGALLVRQLVRFMVAFYSRGDFLKIVREAQDDAFRSTEAKTWIEAAVLEPAFAATSSQIVVRRMRAALDERDYVGASRLAGSVLELERVSSHIPPDNLAEVLLLDAIAEAELDEPRSVEVVRSIVRDRFPPNMNSSTQRTLASAMVRRGTALLSADRNEESLLLFDDTIARFASTDDGDIGELVAASYLHRGYLLCLGAQWRSAVDAISTGLETVKRIGASNLRPMLPGAFFFKAVCYSNLGERSMAMEAAEDAIRVEGGVVASVGPVFQVDAMWMLVEMSHTEGRQEAAAAFAEKAVQRYGDRTEESVRYSVASLLATHAMALEQSGKWREAVAAAEEAVARFGEDELVGVQHQVNLALLAKAAAFLRGGDPTEVIQATDDFETRVRRLGMTTEGGPGGAAKGLRAEALFQMERTGEGMRVVADLYGEFDHGATKQVEAFVSAVIGYVASGARPEEMLALLQGNEEKFAAVLPLAVALGRMSGIEVRAPAEIDAVARDIIEKIDGGVDAPGRAVAGAVDDEKADER